MGWTLDRSSVAPEQLPSLPTRRPRDPRLFALPCLHATTSGSSAAPLGRSH